jgi:hypothetical protein
MCIEYYKKYQSEHCQHRVYTHMWKCGELVCSIEEEESVARGKDVCDRCKLFRAAVSEGMKGGALKG